MAQLTVRLISRTGADLTTGFVAAAAGGDKFANTGREFAYFTNLSGAPITATFETPATIDGLAVADLTASLPSMANFVIGPFPTGFYNDADGNVSISYSGVSSLSVQIFKLPVP